MTVTSKTTTHWSGPSIAAWGKRFTKKSAQDLAAYMTSYNMESQVVSYVDDADDNDLQTTGTKPCMINGVFIPSLTADASMIVADDTTGNAAGTTIADDFERWFIVLADADGTLSLWTAGDAAAIGGNAVLKIPAFDPSTYVALAVILYANDNASAEVTVGAAACDWNTDGTFYQLTGPVFPHPDNFDEN
jgi:hypothetical protein